MVRKHSKSFVPISEKLPIFRLGCYRKVKAAPLFFFLLFSFCLRFSGASFKETAMNTRQQCLFTIIPVIILLF